MNDEQKVLEGMKAIRDYCDGVDSCDVCFFDNNGGNCLIFKATQNKLPEDWNLSPIEEIMKESDENVVD